MNQTSKRQRRPKRQDEPEAPHHPPLLRPPVAGAEGTVGQRGQWLPTALGARGQELSEEPRLRLPLARRLFSVRLLQLSSRAGSLGALGRVFPGSKVPGTKHPQPSSKITSSHWAPRLAKRFHFRPARRADRHCPEVGRARAGPPVTQPQAKLRARPCGQRWAPRSGGRAHSEAAPRAVGPGDLSRLTTSHPRTSAPPGDPLSWLLAPTPTPG